MIYSTAASPCLHLHPVIDLLSIYKVGAEDLSDGQGLALDLQVMDWLSREAQERLADACQALLQRRLAPAIEKDVELLSDSGRDRMFNSASSIFLRLPKIIAARLEGDEQLAFRTVRPAAVFLHCSGKQNVLVVRVAQQYSWCCPAVLVVHSCLWTPGQNTQPL